MNVELHHRFDGPEGAPVLVLSNSLGTTVDMWDELVPALAERFRLLRYDTRGHGRSPVPPAPTRSTTSAATPSPCSTDSGSSGSASAACPSAA